jgi:hypothetical protein
MPTTPEVDDLVTTFQALPRERQTALLGRMTPEQKDKLNAALDIHLGTAAAPETAPTPAPEGYGSAILGAVKRGLTALKGAPEALMNPPDTHYTPKELESKLPIVPRLLFNIPATMANAVENAEAQRDVAARGGEGWAGQALAYGKQLPIIGDIIRTAEPAGPGTQVGPLNVNLSPQNVGAAVEGVTLSEAPKMAVDATVGGLSKVGALRESTRAIAQGKVGASAYETTDKIVDKYNQDADAAKVKQAESDANVAKANADAQTAAQQKTATNQQKVIAKNESSMTQADIDTEQNTAATAKANMIQQEAHQAATQEATTHNQNVAQLKNQAATLDSQLREGSEQLGNDVVDLDKKLRQEGNGKYEAVRAKVGDDPGVPLSDIAAAAKEAQGKLKGAPESIRQFNDLMRKGAADEDATGQMVNGVKPEPGTGLYKLMEDQGLLGEPENLPFDQLQGYSSELGRKLAEGGLPGDVYQAVKYLKEQVDAAKTEIAERNGAGLELQEADGFWNKYQDAFYDKDSAVANVRRRVGVLDPEYYSEPFTKGKAAGVGAAKLRAIPTQYADAVNALAATTERLRTAYGQRGALKIPSEKPLPTAPAPKATGPRAMATLQPIPGEVAPQVTPRTQVPGPAAPTVGEIMDTKAERARTQAYGMGRGSKYDVVTAAGALYALSQGHLWTALAVPAIRFGIPALLKTDGFIDFISKPTAADLAAADKLPPAVRQQVKANIQTVINQTAAAHQPITVSPAIQAWIRTGAAAGTVTNPREAKEALGRPTP